MVAAMLSGLESQPGAVAVRILGPHHLGQLSELLRRAPLPSFPIAFAPRRDSNLDHKPTRGAEGVPGGCLSDYGERDGLHQPVEASTPRTLIDGTVRLN